MPLLGAGSTITMSVDDNAIRRGSGRVEGNTKWGNTISHQTTAGLEERLEYVWYYWNDRS